MNIIKSCNIFESLSLKSYASEIRGLEAFRQSPGLCGAASLHIVMKFFGKDIPEDTLSKDSLSSTENGTEAPEMLLAANKHGFDGFYRDDCEIEDIERFIEQNIPVIVDWFSTDEGHFSVVSKIDKENIYLQDPEVGEEISISLEDFDRVWFDFKEPKQTNLTRRRLLVIWPEGSPPQLNELDKKAKERSKYNSDMANMQPENIEKEKIFSIDNYIFFLVDGEEIRDKIDVDFVAGGNPARYKYVPQYEIWIEKTFSPNDIAATALHEIIECHIMKELNMNYDDAHELASNEETKLRKTFIPKKEFEDYNDIEKEVEKRLYSFMSSSL